MKQTIDFLTNIFKLQCQQNDYIILSAKKEKVWKDIPIRYSSSTIRKELKKVFKKYPSNIFDLYFSPMAFSEPRRKEYNVIETKFLIQDIDEHVNPKSINPKPTYIWESSPNKYQGMWELDRYIELDDYNEINPNLAKLISDTSECTDMPHVYRIPGTTNHKYKNKPKVGFPSYSKEIYKPKALKKLLKIKKEKPALQEESDDLTERQIYARYNIPQKVRELLALTSTDGLDRSDTIWYVENKLSEVGLTPNEIIYLVKNSVFNKYQGRKDEDKRLRKELDKILSNKIQVKDKSESPFLQVDTFEDVMKDQKTFPGWLVKGFWGRRSHGIVAGMPKTMKSTLVDDLVVSVASGKPFLGKYPVEEPGPVIVIQNENAKYIVKDRNEKMIASKGCGGEVKILGKSKLRIKFPPQLPIHYINQKGFIMTNRSHQEQIENLIREVNPVLVVFDPLYLMFDGDLNSAKELNPILNWLLYLKNELNTGVLVIHHYNKGGIQNHRGGQRMMGSITLYGWIESAWYLSREEEEDEGEAIVTLKREFRLAKNYSDLDLTIKMGEIGDPYYEVKINKSGEVKPNYEYDIINTLSTSSSAVPARRLSELIGLSKSEIRPIIDKLVEMKRIKATQDGYIMI